MSSPSEAPRTSPRRSPPPQALNTPPSTTAGSKITKRNNAGDAFNLEETRDFMPQMGPMIGYAVTVVIEPSNPQHKQANPNAGPEYLQYVASIAGPKIVVVQDLDKPRTHRLVLGRGEQQHAPLPRLRRHHYRWRHPRRR